MNSKDSQQQPWKASSADSPLPSSLVPRPRPSIEEVDRISRSTLRQTKSHGTVLDPSSTNHRQILSQIQDEDLSPSSSHSSLVSYFRRTNSATAPNPPPPPPVPKLSTLTPSTSQHHLSITSLNRIKNTVINRSSKKLQKKSVNDSRPHLTISSPLEASGSAAYVFFFFFH